MGADPKEELGAVIRIPREGSFWRAKKGGRRVKIVMLSGQHAYVLGDDDWKRRIRFQVLFSQYTEEPDETGPSSGSAG